MKKEYHDREWLTDMGDSSTPTVVSFAGNTTWREDKEPFDNYMLEIASCHEKVRLHMTAEQSKKDWIKQMKTLHNHIGRYINFLNTQHQKDDK